jgi:hypothetical protein
MNVMLLWWTGILLEVIVLSRGIRNGLARE